MFLNLKNKHNKYFAKIRWCLFVVTAVTLMLFVILMAVLRLSLPYLTSYQDDVEEQLQDALGYPVQVSRMDADWYWFSPRIKLIDVDVYKSDRRSQLIRFDEVIFEFGIFSNLINLSFEPTVISLNGSHLFLLRDKTGQLFAQDLPLASVINGIGSDPAVNQNESKVADLLNNKTIELHDMTVQLTDLTVSSKSMIFDDASLAVEFGDNIYKLYLESNTPDHIGEKVLVITELQKNQESWQSSSYIDAKAINLGYFMQYLKTSGFDLSSTLDTKLWLKLDGLELTGVKGLVASSDLTVSGKNGARRKSWSADKLSTRFQLEHKGEDWQLVFDDLNMTVGKQEWNHLYFSLSYNQKSNALGLRSEYLDLHDAYELASNLPLTDAVAKKIESLRPTGRLRKTDIVIDDWKRPDKWLLKTRFEQLGISLSEKNIRFDGLSGELSLEKDKGQLILDSKKVLFESDYFNDVLNFDTIKGAFNLERDAAKFKINSNLIEAEINAVDVLARLNVAIEDQTFADFQMHIDRTDAQWFNQHRADGILGKKVAGWLEKSIVEAELTDFNFLFHGVVNQLPFLHNEGVLQSAVSINKGTLKYLPNWPEINNIKAKFSTDNYLLMVDAESGSIENAGITTTLTTIDLAGDKHVKVSGNVDAKAADVSAFFMATPLKSYYQSLTQYTELEGGLKCRLHLDIPLDGKSPVNVNGKLDLQGNELVVKDYGYHLHDLYGAVYFDNAIINAKRLTATFNQQPLVASVSTVTRVAGVRKWNQTLVAAQIKSDVNALMPFDIDTDNMFQNETDWQLALEFNHPPSKLEALSLVLKTDLSNVDMQLPKPFKKGPAKKADFYLGVKFFHDFSDLHISYSDLLDLKMGFDSQSETIRSAVRLNSGIAVLPDKGIHLAAKFDEIDLKHWEKSLSPFLYNSESNFKFNELDLDIEVDRLLYDDYQLANIRMGAELMEGSWHVNVDSDEMTGKVNFKDNVDNESPVNVTFSKMNLTSVIKQSSLPASEAKPNPLENISPSKIPPLKVSGSDFSYKNYQFDKVELITKQSSYGLALESMDLKAESVDIKAKGNWFVKRTGEANSSLRLEIESDDVGKVLSSFAISRSLKEGEGKALINWKWPGSPFNFDWKYVKGRMDVEVKEGRFVDIEPGAGRLLGVFSLSALPRRFMLDFSDTFKEGYEFNKLISQASFDQGQLYTDKTYISGTSADVYFKGRIGLADKDYDQVMSVVPRISSGVSGWLAVLQGATVGLVAYVGQKLLGVDEAAKNQYHITGSWSEPLITKLEDKRKPSSLNRKQVDE